MNSERHFHIIQLNNKNVKIGNVSIKKESTPINAAKKLLNNLVKNKLNLKKANILIKESTKDSTKKIYGPYLGYFQKNKLVEIKKDVKKDVKVKTKTSAKLKSKTKLIKMKGGFQTNREKKIEPLITKNMVNMNLRAKYDNLQTKLAQSMYNNLVSQGNFYYNVKLSNLNQEKLKKEAFIAKYKPCLNFFSCLLIDSILNFKINPRFLKSYEIITKSGNQEFNIKYFIRFIYQLQTLLKEPGNINKIKNILFESNFSDEIKRILLFLNDDNYFNLQNHELFYIGSQDGNLVTDVYEDLYFDHLVLNLIFEVKNNLAGMDVLYSGYGTLFKCESLLAKTRVSKNKYFKVHLDYPLPPQTKENSYICVGTTKYISKGEKSPHDREPTRNNIYCNIEKTSNNNIYTYDYYEMKFVEIISSLIFDSYNNCEQYKMTPIINIRKKQKYETRKILIDYLFNNGFTKDVIEEFEKIKNCLPLTLVLRTFLENNFFNELPQTLPSAATPVAQFFITKTTFSYLTTCGFGYEKIKDFVIAYKTDGNFIKINFSNHKHHSSTPTFIINPREKPMYNPFGWGASDMSFYSGTLHTNWTNKAKNLSLVPKLSQVKEEMILLNKVKNVFPNMTVEQVKALIFNVTASGNKGKNKNFEKELISEKMYFQYEDFIYLKFLQNFRRNTASTNKPYFLPNKDGPYFYLGKLSKKQILEYQKPKNKEPNGSYIIEYSYNSDVYLTGTGWYVIDHPNQYKVKPIYEHRTGLYQENIGFWSGSFFRGNKTNKVDTVKKLDNNFGYEFEFTNESIGAFVGDFSKYSFTTIGSYIPGVSSFIENTSFRGKQKRGNIANNSK